MILILSTIPSGFLEGTKVPKLKTLSSTKNIFDFNILSIWLDWAWLCKTSCSSLETIGVYTRNAGFSDHFVFDTVGLIWRISVLNIDCNLLLEESLTFACEGNLDDGTAIGCNSSKIWSNRPLINLQASLVLSPLAFLGILFDLFGLFFSSFFGISCSWC